MKTMAIDGAYPRPQMLSQMGQQARGLSGVNAGPELARRLKGGRVEGPTFQDYLSEQISGVNDTIMQADQRVADVATGRSRNLHEMMIALNKADLSLKMLTQVRNKALEAYQELMRMSL